MSFSEVVEDWVDQALKQRPHCTDEYKVKNGLVEPFINNVRGGMSGIAMCEKYSVTQEKLTELLQQLVSMGHLKSEELPKEDT